MLVSLTGAGPLYQQIYRSLRTAILSGRLCSGDRLPVTRGLAAELKVSRNVVLIAYEQLIAEGYAVGRVGSGTFVAAAIPESMLRVASNRGLPAPPPHPATLRLSAYARRILADAEPDLPRPSSAAPIRYDFTYYRASTDDFPADLWRRLITRRLRALDLEYSPARGDAALRTEISAYLRRARAVESTPDQILLVNGSQQALDLIARVLIDPGDSVVIEAAHYSGAREAFRAAGARLLPIPLDPHGLITSRLPRGRRVRLAYVTPSHQLPTGAILPLDRRLALLAWAARTGAYILEDDYDGEYRYEGRPLEAVQALDRDGRVIYTGTFSRILFPSLRMGYVVMPQSLAPVLTSAKWVADRHTSLVQQGALAGFLREGHLERTVRRAQVRNAARRAALLRAIEKHFGNDVEVFGAGAGVHVLVHFRRVPASRTDQLVNRAAAAGVRVHSSASYYLRPPDRCELVLGYGAMTEREIAAGIRALESAIS
jgi:GntR family transcriptional regulator/MocR family aminotransferase